jgi:drug/metabolite transporter (DMT)-like permease
VATESPAHEIQRPSLAGVVRALGATLCWSSSALLIDRISSTYALTPLQISVWRVAVVLPLLGLVVSRQRGNFGEFDRSDAVWYLGAGLGIAVSNVSWAASVQTNKPAAAAALGFSAPAFIALTDRFLFHRHLFRVQVVAIAVNLVGCGLASGIRSPEDLIHAPAGLIVGLTNGLAFTWYTLLNSHRGSRGAGSPYTVLLAMFAVAEIGTLLWGIPLEGARLFRPHLDLAGWGLMVCLGVGPTLGAYIFFNSSLRLLSATVASLVTTLEPPIVAVCALLLLQRAVTGTQWIGIVSIVAAVLCMQLSAAGAFASMKSRHA